MVQIGPTVLITTSTRPSDKSRILCKLLRHVIPNSEYINRGKRNLDQVHDYALEIDAEYIILISSRGNEVGKLKIYTQNQDAYVLQKGYLEIHEFIDHRILGFKRIPARGPLSCPRSLRSLNPLVMDFMEKYFKIDYDTKNKLWLMIDQVSDSTYIRFVDALTQKKFAMIQVKYKTR